MSISAYNYCLNALIRISNNIESGGLFELSERKGKVQELLKDNRLSYLDKWPARKIKQTFEKIISPKKSRAKIPSGNGLNINHFLQWQKHSVKRRLGLPVLKLSRVEH